MNFCASGKKSSLDKEDIEHLKTHRRNPILIENLRVNASSKEIEMRVIRFLWWAGLPGFGLTCIYYAIAFIGWGLSLCERPQPDAPLLVIALVGAAIGSFERAAEEWKSI